jgi:hypothetical protein
MSDKIDYLKYRLHLYQESRKKVDELNFQPPSDLICLVADLLLEIAKDLPEKYLALKVLLQYVAELLKTFCAKALKGNDNG